MGIRTLFELSTGVAGFDDAKRPSRPLRQIDGPSKVSFTKQIDLLFRKSLRDEQSKSPLRDLEHDLHGPVAYAILPIFAFANAGLSLSGMSLDEVTHPVTLGAISGLVVGKPLGVLGFVGLAVWLRFVELPKGINWLQLLGVAFACGIGFTMSLFIAGLAFEHGGGDYFSGDRLGILVGSVLSSVVAYVLLHISLPHSTTRA